MVFKNHGRVVRDRVELGVFFLPLRCLLELVDMTSLIQRSSGLVQRRTEASRTAAADKDRGSGDDDFEPRRRCSGEEQEEQDKGDSKETRLTLMEEVLLLGLKDREV